MLKGFIKIFNYSAPEVPTLCLNSYCTCFYSFECLLVTYITLKRFWHTSVRTSTSCQMPSVTASSISLKLIILFQRCIHVVHIAFGVAMMLFPVIITSHILVLLVVVSVRVVLLVIVLVVSTSSSVHIFIFCVHIILDFLMMITALVTILIVVIISYIILLVLHIITILVIVVALI